MRLRTEPLGAGFKPALALKGAEEQGREVTYAGEINKLGEVPIDRLLPRDIKTWEDYQAILNAEGKES